MEIKEKKEKKKDKKNKKSRKHKEIEDEQHYSELMRISEREIHF